MASDKIIEHFTNLEWRRGDPFYYPGMARIRVDGDGSCFFHGVCRGFSDDYIRGQYYDQDGKVHKISRSDFVRELRKELAVKLTERVDPNDDHSPIYYDTISRGKLAEFAKSDTNPYVTKYTLSGMQTELLSGNAVDAIYLEFVSNIIDHDIYILDLNKRDVYIIGNDFEIMYKDRRSIVLLYTGNHYDVVGVKRKDGTIDTHFGNKHPFIQAIISRMRAKISNGQHDPHATILPLPDSEKRQVNSDRSSTSDNRGHDNRSDRYPLYNTRDRNHQRYDHSHHDPRNQRSHSSYGPQGYDSRGQYDRRGYGGHQSYDPRNIRVPPSNYDSRDRRVPSTYDPRNRQSGYDPRDRRGPPPSNDPRDRRGPPPSNDPRDRRGPPPSNDPRYRQGPPSNDPRDRQGPPSNDPRDRQGPPPSNDPRDRQGPPPSNDPRGNHDDSSRSQDTGISEQNRHSQAVQFKQNDRADSRDDSRTTTSNPAQKNEDLDINKSRSGPPQQFRGPPPRDDFRGSQQGQDIRGPRGYDNRPPRRDNRGYTAYNPRSPDRNANRSDYGYRQYDPRNRPSQYQY